jgi:4-hydroxy-tetrahydrodipicolinate synthase
MRNPAALPDGVYAASLTPLHDDLRIDHETLATHAHWLLANGCDGLVLLGTTGEANSFSVAERMALLDGMIEAGLPPGRLMVGTGCCAVPDTVALTQHAVAHGVGGVLVLPPFYYKNVSDEGVFAAFDQVIQQVGEAALQIYLYHFPKMSGVAFSPALIERLRHRYPHTVVGMKDSSGDVEHMKRTIAAFPDFRVFAGTERYLLDILRLGGAGCISATTNVTCRLAGDVFARRDSEEARDLQARLTAIRTALEAFPFVATLKHLTAVRTRQASWRNVRPPLHALTPEQTARLEALSVP